MSLDLALNAARTGLAATQRALALVSQNVANASTPGYTRKTLQQEAMTDGAMPLGVRTGDAQRDVDAGLVARIDASRSAEAAADLRENLLKTVEQTQDVTGGDGSLPDSIGALQDGLIALRGSPSDAGLQRNASDAATTVARNLNGLSQAIVAARLQAQDVIGQEVTKVNTTLRQIATLSLQLKASADNPARAALEDERDAAVASLSDSIEVRAVRQSDGSLLLLTRGAALLPLDPNRDMLSVAPGNAAGTGPMPGIMMQGLDVTGSLTGGRLGEAIALRDGTLPRMQAEADLVATHLAGRFAAEGLELFTDTGGAAAPATTGGYAGSAQIGFAARIQVNPTVAADPSLLRDGTHAVAATVGGPSAFTPNPAGGPAGFTTLLDRVLAFSLGGEAATGSPWPSIQVTGLGPNGDLSSPFLPPPAIGDYATRVIASLAADRAAATSAKEDAATLRGALEERFGQQSGVDVDKELAAMVALQNAYAANAKVMSAVQTMWDQLLSTVR